MIDSPGPSTGHRNRAKWGLVVGVRKHFCSIARTFTPDGFTGRIVVCDILIPTERGGAFLHRVISLYAPWDPGLDDTGPSTSFWTEVTNLCNAAPLGFTVIGDFNVVMSTQESSSFNLDLPSLKNLPYYTNFLATSNAIDAWNFQIDHSWETNWTFRSYSEASPHYAVLDCAATSDLGTISTYVQVLKHFIPGTDYRPILACSILAAPEDPQRPVISPAISPTHYAPRAIFPKKSDKHRLAEFRRQVDSKLQNTWLEGIPPLVTSDDEFDT